MIFIGYISDFFECEKIRYLSDFFNSEKIEQLDFFDCENPLKFYFVCIKYY